MVVLADLALILGFALVLQFMRTLMGLGAAEVGLVPYLSWDIFGSLALGAMVGACFAFYLRLVGREVTLVLLGMCVLLSAAGTAFHVEPLLSALAAGLVVENAPPKATRCGTPSSAARCPCWWCLRRRRGASLHVDALAAIGRSRSPCRRCAWRASGWACGPAWPRRVDRRAGADAVDGAGVAGGRDALG